MCQSSSKIFLMTCRSRSRARPQSRRGGRGALAELWLDLLHARPGHTDIEPEVDRAALVCVAPEMPSSARPSRVPRFESTCARDFPPRSTHAVILPEQDVMSVSQGHQRERHATARPSA